MFWFGYGKNSQVGVHLHTAVGFFCYPRKDRAALQAHTVEVLGTVIAIGQSADVADGEGGVLEATADEAGPFGALEIPEPTECDRTREP